MIDGDNDRATFLDDKVETQSKGIISQNEKGMWRRVTRKPLPYFHDFSLICSSTPDLPDAEV